LATAVAASGRGEALASGATGLEGLPEFEVGESGDLPQQASPSVAKDVRNATMIQRTTGWRMD
jgi:hypothetical protein